METDDDDETYYVSSSLIVKLIERNKKMMKKPEVDNNLGESLDTFMHHLNDTQHYLANGIFNVRFAEAGLFLQSSVELYGKKVDVLFDNTLQYQMQLCSYNETENSNAEIAEIVERMKKPRQKRKPVIEDPSNIENIVHIPENVNHVENETNNVNTEINCFEHVTGLSERSESVISCSDEPLPAEFIRYADEKLLDFIFHKKVIQSNDAVAVDNSAELLDEISQLISKNQDTYELNPLYFEGMAAILEKSNITGAIDKEKVQLNGTNAMLQGGHLVSDEELQRICLSKSAVVKINKLPKVLMDSFEAQDDTLMQAVISKLLNDTVTTDTLLQNYESNNSEDSGYNSARASMLLSESEASNIRLSNDDSGIFCQSSNRSTMEGDDTPCCRFNSTIMEENENEEASILNVNSNSQNFSNFFAPLLSSTPKRLPVVRLERMNRKRMKQLMNENQPKPVKKPRIKLVIKCTASENTFEKFYNQNYNPSLGEGEILPLVDDDSSSICADNNNNTDMDIEQDELEFNTTEFCTKVITEIIDGINFDETEPPNNLIQNITNLDPEITYQEPEILTLDPELSYLEKYSTVAQNMPILIDWRNFITPIIRKAENSSKFNIHEYGTKLMDAIPTNENLLFKDLVGGKDSSEVARYFVALLQLANMYNVDVMNTCPGQLATDKLEMTLLTRERYHEHLDNYEAPSENTFRDKLARMHAIQTELLNRPSTSRNYIDVPPMLPPLLHQNISPKRSRSKKQRLHY